MHAQRAVPLYARRRRLQAEREEHAMGSKRKPARNRMGQLSACLTLSSLLSTAHAGTCYESTIRTPTPFLGNNDEIFVLGDGSVWQVKYEYEYLYEYYPNVTVCPDRGKLIVAGKTLNIVSLAAAHGKPAKAQQADKVADASPSRSVQSGDVIESQIDGEFEGWEGETIIKLMNGQIWQQTEYHYNYHYAYAPKVILYRSGGGYKMKIDGTDQAVGVARLK
jgi:hypothetical protein